MKKDFRKNVIAFRRNKDSYFIDKNSRKIIGKLLSMECIKKATTIMLYFDFNNEVKTDQLITKLLSLRKTVVAPVTIKDKKKLIPFKFNNLIDDITIGSYGIREPKQNPSNELSIDIIDIVVVPAVAYDKNCYRLGYGGGFYDRFIENLKNDTITIGIAFDLQIFDSIPKDIYDAQLNYVITENNIYIGKI